MSKNLLNCWFKSQPRRRYLKVSEGLPNCEGSILVSVKNKAVKDWILYEIEIFFLCELERRIKAA